MDEFVRSVGTGQQAPRQVARSARALQDKHPDDGKCAWWARLGGKRLTNVERDMHRRARHLHGVELEAWSLPLTAQSAYDGPVEETFGAIAPHELFAAVHGVGGDQFRLSFLGDAGPEGVADYWSQYAMSMEHHVCVEHGPERGSFIPVFIHSDGGEVYNNEEYSIWSWSSALVSGVNTWDMKQFICMLPERMRIPGVTDACIVQFLAWSFGVLEGKVYPGSDLSGNPLSGRFCNV